MKLAGVTVGNAEPFFLIAGTCVVESEAMSIDTAGALKEMTDALGVFRSSTSRLSTKRIEVLETAIAAPVSRRGCVS